MLVFFGTEDLGIKNPIGDHLEEVYRNMPPMFQETSVFVQKSYTSYL